MRGGQPSEISPTKQGISFKSMITEQGLLLIDDEWITNFKKDNPPRLIIDIDDVWF